MSEVSGMDDYRAETEAVAAAISSWYGALTVGEEHPENTYAVARIAVESLAQQHAGAVEALRHAERALAHATAWIIEPDRHRKIAVEREFVSAALDRLGGR